jgi:hypothetical protein
VTLCARAREVREWVNRDVNDYINRPLWDTPNPLTRNRVDPGELVGLYPILDGNGQENRLYTTEGRCIARRNAKVDDDTPSYGILAKLRDIGELFTSNELEPTEDGEWEEYRTTPYRVFPQAGLKDYGHVQADGVMNLIDPYIRKINKKAGWFRIEHPPNQDKFDDDDDFLQRTPLKAISSQIYNRSMHSIRGSGVQFHDAQLGLVTSALSGSYAQSASEKIKAKAQSRKCAHSLPHERFREKIAFEGIQRELRIENVYVVDMKSVKPSWRSGG